jgi:hypothetical protein
LRRNTLLFQAFFQTAKLDSSGKKADLRQIPEFGVAIMRRFIADCRGEFRQFSP